MADWKRIITQFVEREGLDDQAASVLKRFVDEELVVTEVGLPTFTGVTLDGSTLRTVIDTTEEVAAPEMEPDQRYQDLGLIGLGGMGEVRRVRDRVLQRQVAMKIVRPELAHRSAAVRRFVAEARATAQLQHPSVVPVHDLGVLDDGRPYFTMKEIPGQTLRELIRRRDTVPLRRLVDLLHRAADAVAYAHAHGTVHRDLKPENILIGGFGEVLVVDWGLARVSELVPEDEEPTDSGHTRHGSAMGTPGYMPPEQATGQLDQIGPPSDVFALGAILYEILTGERPFSRDVKSVLEETPEPLSPTISEGLVQLCEGCLRRPIEERPPDASAFGGALLAWLEGARRRERALELVERADALQKEVQEHLDAEVAKRQEAARYQREVQPWAGLEKKRPGWDLEDEADAHRRLADRVGLERLQLLRGALNEVPDLKEAHERLAFVYHFCHQRAVEERDLAEAERYELLLRAHDQGSYASYLRAEGTLELDGPTDGSATLHRFTQKDRRLVEVEVGPLGNLPVARVLDEGSYLITVDAPGCRTARYPVLVTREQTWSGVVRPVPEDQLGDDDVLIPGGPCPIGGQPGIPEAWVDVPGFVIRRFPVTNRDYLAFLDALVARGREELARDYQPKATGGPDGLLPLYGQRLDGTFVLATNPEGDTWQPDWPVVNVDWHAARAYAAWRAEQDGLSWRLPYSIEWEKAARGVDRREQVMGDFLDPKFANVRGHRPGRALLEPVHGSPLDVSVYGVRGMTGNVADWCMDPWEEQDRRDGRHPILDPGPEDGALRVARGGFFSADPSRFKPAVRFRFDATYRAAFCGIRLVRQVDP